MPKYSRIAEVRNRYGDCSTRTIDRGVAEGIIAPPEYLRGRRVWNNDLLDEYDARRQSAPPPAPCSSGGRGQPRKSTISKNRGAPLRRGARLRTPSCRLSSEYGPPGLHLERANTSSSSQPRNATRAIRRRRGVAGGLPRHPRDRDRACLARAQGGRVTWRALEQRLVRYFESLQVDIIDRCGHPHVEVVRLWEGDEPLPIVLDLTRLAQDLTRDHAA